DIIESMGVVKSLEKIKEADIVLYLFDVNTTTLYDLKIIDADLSGQNKKFILVGNKSDMAGGNKKNNYEGEDIIFISAKENTGIEELTKKLFLLVTENNSVTENIIV